MGQRRDNGSPKPSATSVQRVTHPGSSAGGLTLARGQDILQLEKNKRI